MPPAHSAPITSPIFSVSSACGATYNHLFVSKIHNSTNWPPTHCRWPITTLSFSAPKRTPMISLQQKLNQLNLATMSLHLDQMLTDATAKNLSLAQTLEALVDRELEARLQRSIERRFKLSRLQSKPSIDSFHFNHHKSRLQLKTRILRLLDLDFLRNGTSVCLIGNPGVGKTYLAKIVGWRACQANQRVLVTTAMDMLNHLLASQVDHSLIRKRSIPNPLFCWSTSYAIFRSINGLPTSSIRSSPPAIAMSAARSLRPTQPFPTGATSSTTPPSPLPSPIAWWKTPRSSFWEAKASQR